MLNMGSGDFVAVRGWHYVSELDRLFSVLGGIQQMKIGPNPASDADYLGANLDYHMAAERYIKELAADLDVEVVVKRW